MSRTWFDIDFLFTKKMLWGWFDINFLFEDVGADLVLISYSYFVEELICNRFLIWQRWVDVDFIFLIVEGVTAGQPASQKSKAGGFWGSSPGDLSWSGFQTRHYVSAEASCNFRPPRLKYFFSLQYSLKNIFLLIRSLTRGEFTQTQRTRRVQLHLCWFVSTKTFSNYYFDYL